MTHQPDDQLLDEVLTNVRDAGALDDNNGGEDWRYSEDKISEAKQALISWRDAAIKRELEALPVSNYEDVSEDGDETWFEYISLEDRDDRIKALNNKEKDNG